MASRYYNPRLAQKVGAAEAGQYMSITPAVARGQAAFERQQAKQLKQQELRFEKRKLEAEAFKKEIGRRDDILYSVQKNLAKAKKRIDGAPVAIRDRVITLGDMAKANYNQLQNAIKEGKLNRGAALMWQDDNVNKYVEQADALLDKYPEVIKNYSENAPSMINSAADIEISNKIIGQEFTLDENNNAIIKSDDGKKIIATIPFDELANPTYIPVDTEAFTAAFATVNTAADKAASKGKSLDSMKKDVNAALAGLNFTPEQSLSIAFDYLGKEQPEYVNIEDYKNENGDIDIAKFKGSIDMDGDEKFGEPEDLNLWVKSQLEKAAAEAYDGYKKDYRDKFKTDSSENKDAKLNAEEYAEELNSALSNYDFSMLNNTKIGGKLITGSEIRNGKLYLEYIARTTAEGQEMAELAGIDLNDKVRLKALLSEYIKGQKGLSISNKISNNITDEMLFTIEDINKQNSILFASPTIKPNLP